MAELSFDPECSGIVLFTTFVGEDVKTAKMVLDTGATYTTIPWDIAEALGYTPSTTRERVTITTPEGTITAPAIVIKEVLTLGKKARDVKVLVHNLPETSRVDGLLGLSYLRNFKLCLDFDRGVLTIE